MLNWKKTTRILVVWLMALTISHTTNAQNRYSSDILANMAEALNFKTIFDTLPEGIFSSTFFYNDYPLTVTVTADEVEHIGYSLFDTVFLKSNISPACKFIERYLLWSELPIKREHPISLDMELKDVRFMKGNLATLKRFIGDSTIKATIELSNGKKYFLSWMRDDVEECSVNFPVDFCLLRGTNIKENERRLLSDFERLKLQLPECFEPPTVSPFGLKKIEDTNIFILPGDSLYLAELNNNQFFQLDDTVFNPIFDTEHSNESFFNLVVSGRIPSKHLITVKLLQYGGANTITTVPFANLLPYFTKKGCTPYFGIMSNDGQNIRGLLLLANIAEGYCHTIRLTLKNETIRTASGEITGRMMAYIPVSRIKKMYFR